MTTEPRWRVPPRLHVAVYIIVLLVAAIARFERIGQLLPYSEHVDEQTIVSIVLQMHRADDPDPRKFNYPSLPIYLVLGTFVAGGELAVVTGQARGLDELGVRAADYYPVPLAAWFARGLFALLSVAALALIGLIGRAVGGEVLLWFAPLVACLSANYFRMSSLYLNVDIVGTFFALSLLALVVLARREPVAAGESVTAWKRALLWGAFCGFTIGSKYNLFPIVLPCVVWFWFYERRRFMPLVLLLTLATVLAFLAVTPYAILDHRAFLEGTLKEMRHYGLGHYNAGLDGDLLSRRGWPMLVTHVRHFAESFGWPGLIVAAAGVYGFLRRDVKTAVILFSYPLALVAYMSLQVLFRARNVVSTELFVALALAEGIRVLGGALGTLVERRRPARVDSRWVRLGGALVVTGGVLAGVQWYRVAWAYLSPWEPRNAAANWLAASSLRPKTVVVDASLHFDLRTLPAGSRPRVVNAPSSLRASRPPTPGVAIVPRSRARDYARTVHGHVAAEFERRSRMTADHGMEHEAATIVVF